MPTLHFLNRDLAGRAWDLNVERSTVGRRDNNTLVIPDPTVSGEHCEILVFGHEVIVRERGSTNGTFVGNTRVKGQLPAKAGDLLRFGSVEARLEFESEAGDGSTDPTAIWLHAQLKRERPGARDEKATIKLPVSRITSPTLRPLRRRNLWLRDIALPVVILLILVGAVVAMLMLL